MNYKAMTSVYKGSHFQPTVPVFGNPDEALAYAENCAERAFYIADYRVDAVQHSVTHRFRDGKIQRICEFA